MEVLRADNALHPAGILQAQQSQGEHGKEGHETAGPVVHAEHGAEPQRIHTHQQVERGAGDRKGAGQDRKAREIFQALGVFQVAGFVLAHARAPEEQRVPTPDGKVDHPADGERALAQVSSLVGHGVTGGHRRISPTVDLARKNDHRNGQNRQQRHHRGGDFGQAPEHDIPTGPSQVHDRHEDQRAEADAQKKRVVRQVGEGEVLQIIALAEAQPEGDRQTDNAQQGADHENLRPETIHGDLRVFHARNMVMRQFKLLCWANPAGRRCHLGRFYFCRLDRISAGTSSIFALRDNCRART